MKSQALIDSIFHLKRPIAWLRYLTNTVFMAAPSGQVKAYIPLDQVWKTETPYLAGFSPERNKTGATVAVSLDAVFHGADPRGLYPVYGFSFGYFSASDAVSEWEIMTNEDAEELMSVMMSVKESIFHLKRDLRPPPSELPGGRMLSRKDFEAVIGEYVMAAPVRLQLRGKVFSSILHTDFGGLTNKMDKYEPEWIEWDADQRLAILHV